jgi:hypothetical protein
LKFSIQGKPFPRLPLPAKNILLSILFGFPASFRQKKTPAFAGVLKDLLLNYHQVLHNMHPAIERRRRLGL